MTAFICRRLLLLPLVAFGVTVLLFALMQFLSPDQRASLYITDPKQFDRIESVIRLHGLDKPVYVQYWNWLRELAHGNLGWSKTASMRVSEAIGAFFPNTLELTIYMFIPIILIGLWLGTKGGGPRRQLIQTFP